MKYKLPFFYDYVFPTFILPNALITELGIVNYLYSMYGSNNKGKTLFEVHSGDINPLTFIFGNNLGSWPNSVLPEGMLNLHSDCYLANLEIIEESVYLGKANNKGRYIYPIRLSFNLGEFAAHNLPNGIKLNGEYFWKNISAEVLADVRSGRALIFLDYGQENYIDKSNFDRLHNSLRYSNLPKENIILGLNTFNGEEVYSSMFEDKEQLLTVKSWPFVVTNTSYHYAYNPKQHVSITEFEQSSDYIRPHYFLFKIRRPRDHRLMLLYSFASAGLLEKSDWSCLSRIDYNENNINMFQQLTGLEYDCNKIQQLHSYIPHSLKSENSDYEDISAWTDRHPQPYKDAYFYVCTETYTRGTFKSLTEKVFKPIVNLQPFIFVAYCGALSVLKKLGFRTFSPYIDESYDDEPDVHKRIAMVHKEVTRLCSMSKEEIHKWYWDMRDTLLHNQQIALTLHKNENLNLNFIKYLDSRLYQ